MADKTLTQYKQRLKRHYIELTRTLAKYQHGQAAASELLEVDNSIPHG